MKGHSIPLIILHDFDFTPDRAHPTMTYGYEQPNLAGHAQVLKGGSLRNEWAGVKKKG